MFSLFSDYIYHFNFNTVLLTSFRKSFFCLVFYTEEVNLQSFVMI